MHRLPRPTPRPGCTPIPSRSSYVVAIVDCPNLHREASQRAMHKTDTGPKLPRPYRSGKAQTSQESMPVGRPYRSPKFRLQSGERSLYIHTKSDLPITGGRKGGADQHVQGGTQRELGIVLPTHRHIGERLQRVGPLGRSLRIGSNTPWGCKISFCFMTTQGGFTIDIHRRRNKKQPTTQNIGHLAKENALNRLTS